MLRPRSYQQEMLQESLKRNIIVAMDTGSGKTQMYDIASGLSDRQYLPNPRAGLPEHSVT